MEGIERVLHPTGTIVFYVFHYGSFYICMNRFHHLRLVVLNFFRKVAFW